MTGLGQWLPVPTPGVVLQPVRGLGRRGRGREGRGGDGARGGDGCGCGPGGCLRAVRTRVRRGYRRYRGAVGAASGPGAVRGVRAPRARGRRTAGCCTHRARAVESPPVRGRARGPPVRGPGLRESGPGLRARAPRARVLWGRVPWTARAPPARAVRVCPRPARPRPVHPPRRMHSPALKWWCVPAWDGSTTSPSARWAFRRPCSPRNCRNWPSARPRGTSLREFLPGFNQV